MAKNLVIVESPAKVKTIKKFLGSNYEVDASGGHVRDLPKSTLGVDVEHGYEPKYITIRGKGDVLARLRKEVKKADKIYLATDPDREGEAISWHLMKALKLDEPVSYTHLVMRAAERTLQNQRCVWLQEAADTVYLRNFNAFLQRKRRQNCRNTPSCHRFSRSSPVSYTHLL